jgi:iron complex outermembrane receptor protein
MPKILLCVFFLIGLVYPFSAFAEVIKEPSPDIFVILAEEQVFTTASRYRQNISDAPSAVSIITAEEIKKYGYRTLADVLKSVRGMLITYDRNYTYIRLPGFHLSGDYNSRILVLIDGHRTNDGVYDGAYIGHEFPVDIDDIDKIEIVRGPGSSLYGANAVFGVINVITKKPASMSNVTSVTAETGSLGSNKAGLRLGKQLENGGNLYLSLSYYDSDGHSRLFYPEYTINNGIAEGLDSEYAGNFFLAASFDKVTVRASYTKRQKGVPTASFEQDFNLPGAFSLDRRGFLDGVYNSQINKAWHLMGRLYYDYYGYDQVFVYTSGNYTGYGRGEWWGGEFQATNETLRNHKLVIGSEYRDRFRQDQTDTASLNELRSSNNWALFLQDEYVILPNMRINAGVRHDQYTIFGGSTNPRLALIYHPLEKTTLKFVSGRAFRAPNAYELYVAYPAVLKPNPNLKPETSITHEVVWEQEMGQHLKAIVTAFYTRSEGIISQSKDPSDGLNVFQNQGEIVSHGAEAELSGIWPSGMQGSVSYSFHDGEDKKTGLLPIDSPQHLINLNHILPLIPEKLFFGSDIQFVSKRQTFLGNTAPSFTVMNITLYSLNFMNWEVSANVYNLFDKQYGDVPTKTQHKQDLITQDGRVYRLKTTYHF